MTGFKKSKARSIGVAVVTTLGLTILVLALANVNTRAWLFSKVMPTRYLMGCSIEANFAPHRIEYQFMVRFENRDQWKLTQQPDEPGSSFHNCVYSMADPQDPIDIRWRYVVDPSIESAPEVWHYQARLQVPFPEKGYEHPELAIRFYPEGRIAARYLEVRDSDSADDVEPKVTDPDWLKVQIQGRSSPTLSDKERQALEAGTAAKRKEEREVFVTGFNFTSHGVRYRVVGKRTTYGNLSPPSDVGGLVWGECCYQPDYAGQPLEIQWLYDDGIYFEKDSDVWHYKATLNPPSPKDKKRPHLRVRFYPGGRVAAGYTDSQELIGDGKISPKLNDPDWVQAQGTPLPALLEKEQKARDAGQGAELETRPAPVIPAAAAASPKTKAKPSGRGVTP